MTCTRAHSDVTTRPPPTTFSVHSQDRTAISAPIADEKNGTHCYGIEGYGYFNTHNYTVDTYVAINRLVTIKLHLSID